MRWPDRETVRAAVTVWGRSLVERDVGVVAVGYFGSLARPSGWGVGSDADLLVLVETTETPFEARAVPFDTASLPVPADVLVYTLDEWRPSSDESPFRVRMRREVVWMAGTDPTVE